MAGISATSSASGNTTWRRPHVETALGGRSVSYEFAASLAGRGLRWLMVTLSPDADGAGAVRGLTITMADVTEYKAAARERDSLRQGAEASARESSERSDQQARDLERSQATLREREARLRAILGSAVDGIISIDESGAIQSLNPAAERLFGYSEAEILGQNVSLLMPPPYREEHDGYLHAYLKTAHARIIGIGREVEARRKNGEVFPIHLSVGEARLGSRKIFTGIIHDLTLRNRLQEQLAQSQKMEAVGRLAGGVAHDFNNVLQTVLTRCEAMKRRLGAQGSAAPPGRRDPQGGRPRVGPDPPAPGRQPRPGPRHAGRGPERRAPRHGGDATAVHRRGHRAADGPRSGPRIP